MLHIFANVYFFNNVNEYGNGTDYYLLYENES